MDFHQNTQPEETDETINVPEQEPVSNEQPANDPYHQIPTDSDSYQSQIPYDNQAPSQIPKQIPYGNQARPQNQNQAPYANQVPRHNQVPHANQVPGQNQNQVPYSNQFPRQNQNPYGNNGPYGNDYSPFPNNGYRQAVYPMRKAEPGSSLANAAMILGIIAIICCFTFTIYPAFILGSIAILLALLSKGRRPALFPKARTGIICAVIGLVLNTILLTSALAAFFTNEELRQEVNEIIEYQYGMSFDELMEEIMNGYDY